MFPSSCKVNIKTKSTNYLLLSQHLSKHLWTTLSYHPFQTTQARLTSRWRISLVRALMRWLGLIWSGTSLLGWVNCRGNTQRKHVDVEQPQEFHYNNNDMVKADVLLPPSSAMSSVMRLKLSPRPLDNPEVDIYPPAALKTQTGFHFHSIKKLHLQLLSGMFL